MAKNLSYMQFKEQTSFSLIKTNEIGLKWIKWCGKICYLKLEFIGVVNLMLFLKQMNGGKQKSRSIVLIDILIILFVLLHYLNNLLTLLSKINFYYVENGMDNEV